VSEPVYHSSGAFSLDPGRQTHLLGELSLEEPAQAILWLVQAAVALGCRSLSLSLNVRQVRLRLRCQGPVPPTLPPPCERLTQVWPESGQEVNGSDLEITWKRQVSRRQVTREIELLRQRCSFCPIPLQLSGYVLQPEVHRYSAQRPEKWIPSDYHLAEYYAAAEASQAGIAVFRPDADKTRGPRINTPSTFWRELEPGVLPLRWWMPWRVAGQVARHKRGKGFRAAWAAFLLAQTGQPSRALAVSQGVVVKDFVLNWPDLPGLLLIFDSSQRQLDISHLNLVDTLDLRGWLEERRQQLTEWVNLSLPRWQLESRSHNVTARQNKKEVGAWLSIWGLSLVSGLGIYLPLPLLALPWIVWHHSSRRKIFARWKERLIELQSRHQ